MLRSVVGEGRSGPAAVVIDLENVLHPVRQFGSAGVAAGLRAVMVDLSAVANVEWVTGVGDYWLCRMLVSSAAELRVRLFPGPIGPDRADGEVARRLLTDVPARVGQVILASGDGGFVPVVQTLQRRGWRVTVAARPGSLSAALELVADRVVDLASLADVPAEVA